ncbi:MAG: hypothetical protein IJF37_10785 [Lachnospiraceae bacterium]|nr:hypothetical protein [Lachnospiraceae bacterium]
MKKTLKDYEREEERKKDLRVLYVLIPLILLTAFCLWLFRDIEQTISKTYDGILVNMDDSTEKQVTAQIDGRVTYESMFSNKVVSYTFDIILTDNNGNVVLNTCSSLDSIDGELSFSFSSGLALLRVYHEESHTIEYIGNLICDEDFEQILLKLYNNTYYAAPAKNIQEAEKIFSNK